MLQGSVRWEGNEVRTVGSQGRWSPRNVYDEGRGPRGGDGRRGCVDGVDRLRGGDHLKS